MKPSCQPFFLSLSPFADGELSPAERVRVEQHLSGCPECAGRVADLRAESGLIRVGMEMLTDDVDFSGFSQAVMARLTPARLPLLERLRLSLSEMFAYQRGMMLGAVGAAAAVAVVGVAFLARGNGDGYANAKMALHSVTTDEGSHVAPVVMQTDEGDSIIWVVDHAHVATPVAAPDALQKEVDSGHPAGQKDGPKGGEL